MKWLVTYTLPNDKLGMTMTIDPPHADTFKKVRRWWRKSEHKKLWKGIPEFYIYLRQKL